MHVASVSGSALNCNVMACSTLLQVTENLDRVRGEFEASLDCVLRLCIKKIKPLGLESWLRG